MLTSLFLVAGNKTGYNQFRTRKTKPSIGFLLNQDLAFFITVLPHYSCIDKNILLFCSEANLVLNKRREAEFSVFRKNSVYFVVVFRTYSVYLVVVFRTYSVYLVVVFRTYSVYLALTFRTNVVTIRCPSNCSGCLVSSRIRL